MDNNNQQNNMQQQYYQQQYEMQQQYYQQQYEIQQQNYSQPSGGNYTTPAGNGASSGSSNGGNGGKKKTGLIIGIIIAILAVIAVVVIIVVAKNKKSEDSDKKSKTTTESEITEAKDTDDGTTEGDIVIEDTVTEEADTSTEEAIDDVNHDPSVGTDYVPENPIIVDNEVMTIEIVNIHHPQPGEDFEDARYRWDLKVTNNRAKGGIWVNFYFVRYNGVEIGRKTLTPQSRVAKGQTREVSIIWLDDHNWDYDYTGFSEEPSSLEFYAEAEDEDYNFLIGEDVAFYPNGQENAVSDVPDLSGLTPMIDYNGVKFYITRVNTQEEDDDTICIKGFVVNDSDIGYDFNCWGDEVEVNGNGAFGNSLGFDLYPNSVHYFQGWMDLPEGNYVYDGEDVEIGMQYEMTECFMDIGRIWTNRDNPYPVVEGTMFKCIAPAIKTSTHMY